MKQKQSDKMKKLMAELNKAEPKKKKAKAKPKSKDKSKDKKESLLAKVTKVITRKQQ